MSALLDLHSTLPDQVTKSESPGEGRFMPRRLTLVVHSLANGGAERVLAGMANHWAARGDEVTLITLDRVENDKLRLNSQVRRIGLDAMRETRHVWQALTSNFRQVRLLRRAIRDSRPEHVVSFTDKMNIVTLLASRGLGLDVVIAERTDPRQHNIGRIWSMLRRWVYPRCRALVVQTIQVRDFMRQIVAKRPVYVIPNFVSVPAPVVASPGLRDRPTGKVVVGMGRLVRSKGFHLLIDAFARVASQHPDWTLRILGEGPCGEDLAAQVARLGLSGRVRLDGWIADPSTALRYADVFVMSSNYEGFPNALLEAMAAGLPAISFDCESGPAEIIRHNVDGLLIPVDDVDALTQALGRLMSDDAERRRLASAAPEVARRFSIEKYFLRWDAVLRGDDERAVLQLDALPECV